MLSNYSLLCWAVIVFVALCCREAICHEHDDLSLGDSPSSFISVIAVSTQATTLFNNVTTFTTIQPTTMKPRRRKTKRKRKRKHFKKTQIDLNNEKQTPRKSESVSEIESSTKYLEVEIHPKKAENKTLSVEQTTKKLVKKRRRTKKKKKKTHKGAHLKSKNNYVISNLTSAKHFKPRDRCLTPIRGGCSQICFSKGKTKCGCYTGFSLRKDYRSCYDIDECKDNNGGCQSTCKNTIGSYRCLCDAGMRISQDRRTCEDVNECLLNNGHGPCQDTCLNKVRGYECNCKGLFGTKLAKDGHSCFDDEECPLDHGCSHMCVTKRGIEFCKCPDGMELSPDWKTCRDIDECNDEFIKSSCPHDCINTIGSYYCQNSSEIQSEQSRTFPIACKPLYPPSKGFYSCSRKAALPFYSRKGRKRIINSPGTVCRLVCPKATKISGYTFLVCGSSGKWEGKDTGRCIDVVKPKIECAKAAQKYKLESGFSEVFVQLPKPKTNVDWKFVTTKPEWAKSLSGILEKGLHQIEFSVHDPRTDLSSTCVLDVDVKE